MQGPAICRKSLGEDGHEVKPSLMDYLVVPWDTIDLEQFNLIGKLPGPLRSFLNRTTTSWNTVCMWYRWSPAEVVPQMRLQQWLWLLWRKPAPVVIPLVLFHSRGFTPQTCPESSQPVQRQREEKRTSYAEFTLRPNFSAVRLDDAFDDEEAKTGPLPCGTWFLPEPIKDARKLVFRNSRTGVLNRKLNIIFELPGAYRDRRARRREFNSIANKVGEHLHDSLAVHKYRGNVACNFGFESDISQRCQWLHQFHRFIDQRANRVQLPFDQHMIGFDTRCRKQVFDKPRHLRRRTLDSFNVPRITVHRFPWAHSSEKYIRKAQNDR